jgi:hypothetical protein
VSTFRPQASPAQDISAPAPRGLIGAWTTFWFSPADPIGLNALRVLGGLLFLLWLLPFAGHQDAFFGLNGWFDARAYHDASHLPGAPPHMFSWSIVYACGTNSVLLGLVYWASVAVLVLFTLGLWTRATGVLTYVVLVSFTANPAISYDVDPLLVMLAFYLMLGHLLLGLRRPGQTLAARLFGPRETWLFHRRGPDDGTVLHPSVAANLAVRLLQVHFAVVMLASGLYKLQVREWWSGVAPWFYLNPPLSTSLEQVQRIAPYAEPYLFLLSLTAYTAVAWQVAFPAFAWRPRWRPLLLGGALFAGLTDAFLFRLPLLGPVMIIGCLSYLSPWEWRWATTLLARLPGLRRLQHRAVPIPEPSAGREARKEVSTSAVSVGRSR